MPTSNQYIYRDQLIEASRNGDLEYCNTLIDKGVEDFNDTMTWMAICGCENIVKLLIEKGATDYNCCMFWAAYHNRENIVKLMLNLGADNFNESMSIAADNGRENIVRLMLEHGVDINELQYHRYIKDKIIKESREEFNNLKMVLEYLVGDPSFAILMSNELVKVYD